MSWSLRTPAALVGASQGVFVHVPDVIAHHAPTFGGWCYEGPPTDHGYGLTYSATTWMSILTTSPSGRRDLACYWGD